MDRTETIGWFLLGCAIGFVFGYIVRALREIKEELDEVDEIVKRDHYNDESGLVRYPFLNNIVLLTVVCITVWAAFVSQKVSNDVLEVQNDQAVISSCNQEYLIKTIDDLNERTTYTDQQLTANVELQRAQAEFLRVVLLEPPAPERDRRNALQAYFDGLSDFVVISGLSQSKVNNNPYSSPEELTNCYESSKENANDE